jgi:SNF2 family DNA or RNA helicase
MTGTPILNKPQELFSLLHVVNWEMFRKEKDFLDDYCVNYAPNRWKFRHGGLERLMKFMGSFFIQRDRDDVGSEVPPPAITTHRLEKDKLKYRRQYAAEKMIKETAQLLLEDGTRKDIFFMLELILRQRQAMTWPAGIMIRDPETKEILCNFDVEESQKLDAAMELIDEFMEEGERVIIFSQFKAPLYEMHERAMKAGYRSVVATGDQTHAQKNAVREDFDLKTAPENPRYQLAFATYKAFGTGINLNAARQMILLDQEWNPGGEDQAIGRIDRMNSTDQASVHIFHIKDSIDDFMEGLIEEKRGITGDFNEAHNTREMLMKYLLEG